MGAQQHGGLDITRLGGQRRRYIACHRRSTVTFHIRHVLSQLGLPSHSEVVVVAVQQHLVRWSGSH
ncbi:MAG: hypothetical protein M3380_16465, partial [Chloroflexota bacterium]|nr:hypothetical protein [Chloroflexota bacterium]